MRFMDIKKSLTAKDMAFCGLFAALIGVGAFLKISIPVEPFPMHFTLQLFFVLLAGFILGNKKGALCVCIYLGVGLVGIPVFAVGGGPAYVIRPTFGFLLGFVLAAYVTGSLSSVKGKGNVRWNVFAAFLGMMMYYGIGMIYFYVISNFIISKSVTWQIVFINCFLITVAGDFILCILAAALAHRLRAFDRWI